MKYCKSCNMKYECNLTQCLFCNNPLSILSEQNQVYLTNYPAYQKSSHGRSTFLKISTFLLILANLLCLFINYSAAKALTWSVYVCSGTLYALLVIMTLAERSHWLKKATQLTLLTDALMLALGAAAGNYHWCTDLVIPITFMALNFLSILMILGKRERMFQYSIYSFSLSFLGLLYGLLQSTKIIESSITLIVGMIYAIVTIAAILVFSPKASWEELRRRFHI